MEPIVQAISENLQFYRKEMQMTLQELSRRTGVSRSMLSGIEQGSTSPTITVLAKIAAGLKMPISDLLRERKPDCQLIHREAWAVLHGDEGHRADLVFPYNSTRNFELVHLTFAPGAVYQSEHQKSVEEYTMVYQGTLTILLDDVPYTLHAGDSFTFNSAKVHVYRNDGAEEVKAYSVIYYPEKGAGF